MRLFCSALISIWLGFGGLAMAQGTPQAALDNGDIAGATRQLQTMSENADAEQAIEGLAGLAQIAMMQKDYDKAAALLDQAQEKLADRRLFKSAYHIVVPYLRSMLAESRNDLENAKAEIRKARANLDNGYKFDEAWRGAVEYRTSILFNDDNTLARRSAEAAIVAFRSQKMQVAIAMSEIQLAELEWNRGKTRRTFVGYENALIAYRNDGHSQDKIAELQLMIAEKHIKLEEYKAAASRLETAETEIRVAGNPPELIEKLAALKAQIKE